jgi:hypothetical protein
VFEAPRFGVIPWLKGFSSPRKQLSFSRKRETVACLPWHSTWHIYRACQRYEHGVIVDTGFSMRCEGSRGREDSAMMILISHCDVRISHGMHAHYMSSDAAGVGSGRFQSACRRSIPCCSLGATKVPWSCALEIIYAFQLCATLKGRP